MEHAAPLLSPPSPPLEINPDVDRARMADTFRNTGRVHIPNILTEASAQRLFRALERETSWTVTFNEGKNILEFDKVPTALRQQMSLAAWKRANSGFQYIYDLHLVSRYGEAYPNPDHYFRRLIGFLNAPHFVAFMREVTGLDTIAWMNALATRYRPGDFLTVHDDLHGDHTRLVAYVLNMTPNWQPDWGGALQFFDARDHIQEAYLPTFNALNLFRVPKAHSVGQVAMFGSYRYSVTGWYHAAEPGKNFLPSS
jgi:SM-20-related protein